jgi:hypothetical protein
MKKKPPIKKKPELDDSFPKWQTGEYARAGKLNCSLPQSFLAMCKLTDVTPRTVIIDFRDNLSCGSWKREGRDTAKE